MPLKGGAAALGFSYLHGMNVVHTHGFLLIAACTEPMGSLEMWLVWTVLRRGGADCVMCFVLW